MPTERTLTARPKPIRRHRVATKRGTRPALLAVALALAASLLPAARAVAAGTPPSWSAPAAISEPGARAYEPQVAVDPAGDAVVAWMHWTGSAYSVQVATRPAGGPWSAFATVSSPGAPASNASVAIDADGDAVVAYQQYTGKDLIEVRTHAAGASAWSGSTTVSDPGREASEPEAAIDAAGDAVVLFLGADAAGHTIVQATAEQGFGGEWGAPIPLSPAGSDAETASLAMDAAGDAFAVWRHTGTASVEVQESQRPAGGSWSSPLRLSAAGQNAIEPSLAVDPKGDVAVIWERFAGTDIAQVTTRRLGGAWTVPQELSDESEYAYRPRVALDGQGDATAIWSRSSEAGYAVRVATAPAGSGLWSAPTDISPPLLTEPEPTLAVDPAGDAVASWGIGNGLHTSVDAATRKGTEGAWSAPVGLSAPGALAAQPQVGIDANGHGLAVWQAEGNLGEGVQFSAYDPGTEAPEEVPAGGTSGGGETGGSGAGAGPSAGGGGPASVPSPTAAAAPPCPAGKSLRKVKVRVAAKRSAHGKKPKPRFETVARCVKPAPHRKRAKHRNPPR
jgi:hypothetical protein